MKLILPISSAVLFLSLIISHCDGINVDNLLNYAVRQYSLVADEQWELDNVFISTGNPLSTGWDRSNRSMGWTVGFYCGSLWKLFKLTNDDYWKTQALRKQETVKHRQFDTNTHDVGFVIMSSFGNGLALTQNESYIPIIIQTAASLSTRYHNLSGVLRSWNNDADHGGVEGEVKVIADNMMNLELLFVAAQLSGNNTYREIAISHAQKTMENHFRPDGEGIFHVVAYNETTGLVRRKYNWQGYADDSTWARGLAWVIHGYATTYDFTRQEIFLEVAEWAAAYFLNRLPEDHVPYYDFDCPYLTTPYQPRDTSAAAITAHALLKLHISTGKASYLDAADAILESLSSPKYRADGNVDYKIPAILVNGTVFYNEGNIDTAIIYGDFYFLEALDLYRQIQRGSAVKN